MKSIFEQLDGTYRTEEGYFIPKLILTQTDRPIGKYGRQHMKYLKENRRVTYTNLLTSGTLNEYLANLNEQAEERFGILMEHAKQSQGITEELKSSNQMEWVQQMNNAKHSIEEIINRELIYR